MGALDPIFEKAAAQYNLDPRLLKSVAMTESSLNPQAVSSAGAVGVMQIMPSIAKAYGVQNAYDPEQNINAGARLLRENLDASNGDEKRALMMYHGGTDVNQWGDKTKAYPGKVYSNQSALTQQEISSNDPVYRFLTGQPVSKDSVQTNKPSGDPVYDFLSSGGKNLPNTVKTSQPQTMEQNVASAKGTTAAQYNKSAQAQSGESAGDFYKGLASVADTLYGVVPAVQGTLTYAVQRALQKSPAEASAAAQGVQDSMSNPVGKLFGITNDPAYKNEGSKYLLSKIGQIISPTIDSAEQTVSNKTGIPLKDVSNIAQSVSYALPKIASNTASVIGSGINKVRAIRNEPLPEIYNTPTGTAGTIANANGGAVRNGTAQVGEALDQGGGSQPITRPASGLSGVGAAQANVNSIPALSGEEAARGPFPVVKTSKIPADVTPQEQSIRAQIANEVLGDKNRVRTGVITGNEDALRTEHTLAASPNPTPQGMVLRQQIADEQNALSNYAKQRIEATGALPTFDSDYARGEFVNNVLTGQDGLTGYLKQAKNDIYAKARAATQDQPVQMSNLDKLLGDNRFNAELKISGQKDFTGGLSDLVNTFKTEGFEGAPAGSVAAAEKLRQYLTRQWSPQNKYFIGQAVKAIDDDVASAGGAELFQQGRALHAAEKTIFGSKGIKNLFGDIDPNGVQTATAFENIPKRLINMPVDEFKHIYDTVDSLSNGKIPGASNLQLTPELQQAAAQAKNEISGMLARKIYESGANKVGVWNQNSANSAMNGLSKKLEIAMPPDELQKFHTLNYAGQIMPGVHSYEGAGNQLRRMDQQGLIEKIAAPAGAEIGAKIPIPGAAAMGAKIGEGLSERARMRRLADLAKKTDAQMEANSKLGINP